MIELDKKIFLLLNGDLGQKADSFFVMMSSHWVFVVLAVVAILIIWKKYGFMTALFSLILIGAGIGLCDMTSNVFKYHIEKFRPMYTADIQLQAHMLSYKISSGLYGPVSAHAATIFFVALFSLKCIKNIYYTICAILVAILVSYSRIYLCVHFPLDIIAGIAIGAVYACVLQIIFNKLTNKLYINDYYKRA